MDLQASESLPLEGIFPSPFLVSGGYENFPPVKTRITKDSVSCTPYIAPDDTKRYPSKALKQCVNFQMDDIIGCHLKDTDSVDGINLYIYAYPHQKKFASKKTIRRKKVIILFFDKHRTELASEWQLTLQSLIRVNGCTSLNAETTDACQLLVLINPHSGQGKAHRIFTEKVKPMFVEANIAHKLVVTEYAGNAGDMMKTLKLSDYCGIVIVSGDGLIHEVFNGLMSRPDWETAMCMPIGVIPGGSGNALCSSISYAAKEPHVDDPVLAATFVITKHRVLPMDMVAVDTCKGRVYSFVSITWGLISDIDIESEKYRQLGESRFTIGLISRLINLRRYRGRLSYLPASDDCSAGDRDARSTAEPEMATDAAATLCVTDSDAQSAVQTPLLGPLTDPVPAGWVTVEDSFATVAALTQTHLSLDCLAAPACRLDDGLIHLLVARGNISRFSIVRAFLAMQDCRAVDEPDMRMIAVRAFRLVPLTDQGMLAVDGERVAYGPIQAQVLPSLARVMAISR